MMKLMLAAAVALGGAGWAADEAPGPAGKEESPAGIEEPFGAAKSEAPAVTIAKGVLCTAVADKEAADPKESGAEFEAAVERVYFWNAAAVASPPQTVKHIWSKDGKPVAQVSLELKHVRMRTWSSKKVSPGAWKVETVSFEGTVLAVAEFTVRSRR